MVDFLTHYYRLGTEPFRCLSALPDDEAIKIMEVLFDETPFGSRFENPVQYLHNRKRTEQWVRETFIARGGLPNAAYPIPMVLGTFNWMVKQTPDAVHAEVRIPLSAFGEADVSFTYPDSMLSLWFGSDKPIGIYQPAYHGKVFTRSEILSIVEAKGMPEDVWEANLSDDLAPYIEAQVWNHQPLEQYRVRS